jgi:hypothetical protein
MVLATVFRITNFGINAIDKRIEAQANQEHHPREDRRWQCGMTVSAKEGLQSSAQ